MTLNDALALATGLSDLGRHDRKRALAVSEEFLNAVRSNGDPAIRAVARRARAHARRGLHLHREALADYRVALRAFESAGLPLEAARTAIGLVDVLAHLGRIAEARHLAARAHRTFANAGEARRAARLDVNLANFELRLDHPSRALARYASAERVFQQLDHPLDLALTRFNRANALVELGRLRVALPMFESSAALWASADMHASVGQCQLAHADALFRLGRVQPALNLFDDARRLAGPLGDGLLESMAALAAGRVALAARLHEEACASLDAAVRGFAGLGMVFDEGEALLLRATLHARRSQRGAAVADLDRAEDRFRVAGNVSRVHEVLLARTRLLGDAMTDAEEARLRRSLPVLRGLGLGVIEAEARIVLATRRFERGDAAAGVHRKRARALLSRWAEPGLAWRLDLLDARVAARQGQLRPMAKALDRAAAHTDALVRAMPTELLRAGLSAERDVLEDWGVRLWLESCADDRLARAFRWSDRAHVPRMAWLRDRAGGSQRSSTAEAIAERRAELDALDAAAATGARSPTQSQRRTRVVAGLQQLLERLEREAYRAEGRRDTRSDLARLPGVLEDQECLVEYFVGRDAIHAFTVTQAGLGHLRLDAPPDLVQGQAFRLRRLLDRRRLEGVHPGPASAALDDTERRLIEALRVELLEPVLRGGPGNVPTLTIVPHRWLRAVPFHALAGAEGDIPPVRYMLSARDRVPPDPRNRTGSARHAPERPARGGPRVLVVGVASDAAPDAEQEAREVAACHPGATLLLGDAATHDAVATHWAEADLVHVAAHGGLEPDEPRLSGIRLGHGSWTAFDISARRARAQLVVLSACRTGENVLWGGDEAFGLVPALLGAGVGSAIVSLWPVRDVDARCWMQEFHGRLAAGVGAAPAWLEATQSMRRVSRSACRWAVFAHYAGPMACARHSLRLMNDVPRPVHFRAEVCP